MRLSRVGETPNGIAMRQKAQKRAEQIKRGITWDADDRRFVSNPKAEAENASRQAEAIARGLNSPNKRRRDDARRQIQDLKASYASESSGTAGSILTRLMGMGKIDSLK